MANLSHYLAVELNGLDRFTRVATSPATCGGHLRGVGTMVHSSLPKLTICYSIYYWPSIPCLLPRRQVQPPHRAPSPDAAETDLDQV